MDILRDPLWQFVGVVISAIGTIIPLFTNSPERGKQEPNSSGSLNTNLLISLIFLHFLLFFAILIIVTYNNQSYNFFIIFSIYIFTMLLIAILYKYRLLLVKILSFAVVAIGLALTIMLFVFASTNSPHLNFVAFTNLPSLNFVAPTPATPLSQAQAMLQQFYSDINKKDYCDAYKLWIITSPDPPTCQDFAQGYQNTVHVDILFDKNQSTLLDDDKVFVTLNVTDRESNAINRSAYHGWYIVKRQNGTWKIQVGTLCPISQTTCTT